MALTTVRSTGISSLPAISGANLTSLTAGNLTGTLPAISGANLTGVGGDNKPYFRAWLNQAQSLSSGSQHLMTLNGESFDPDSKWDASSYRFTPAVSGQYFLKGMATFATSSDFNHGLIAIYKNGSEIALATTEHDNYNAVQVSTIIDSDTDDYFEIKAYQNSGGDISLVAEEKKTYFLGFKLIT